VLEEISLPSYSQVSTGEKMTESQKNSSTLSLYPELNGALEKVVPVSDISESSESTTVELLYKSRIDRQYDIIARQWGFDDKKTKEENIDIIQQKATILEERLDEQRFPREEEVIELEAGKRLVEILPTMITSLMPIKIKKDPQQEKPSYEDLPSTSQSLYQTYNPVTPTYSLDFEILWQKAIKRLDSQKRNQKIMRNLQNAFGTSINLDGIIILNSMMIL